MSNFKELKSIELSSFTTVSTGISVLFSIIAAILVTILVTAAIPNGASISLYLIPTIIVGSFMLNIYTNFSNGFFYNLLAKKLRTIAIELKDDEIVKVSTTETAMMAALILTIQVILFYLVSVFILPLFATSIMQTLMLSGQQILAYNMYQALMIMSQPTTIALIIFGTLIITFVFVLLGTYIYNIVAPSGRGIVLKLSQENGMTSIDSINPLKLAIMFAIISGVLSLITGLISLVSGGSAISVLSSVLGGFIGGFVGYYLTAIFYNFLSDKFGKIKIELIDLKIN